MLEAISNISRYYKGSATMAYDNDEEYKNVSICFMNGCFALILIAVLIVMLGIGVATFALTKMLLVSFGM